ncbi:MAG TPA: ornithine carbamoyltransferase [Acidimicrobiia bacterium]|nr:ornithine carbamoyltransferase [Acidimicrobiia bacterium]
MSAKRDFLEVDDLTPVQFEDILARAQAWKAEPGDVPRPLDGRGVALLFEKPSARTRTSTEMAAVTLGGHPVYIRPEEVGLGVRETVEDVARTLACYCSLLAGRVFAHATLESMAGAVEIPVVNLLSDRAHPCQALADYLTLREEFGSLEGRRLVFVGDGNNVAASLAFGAALSGIELTVASPAGYELDDDIVDRARNLGGSIEISNDPYEAVKGADAVYTDVWTSMGQEEEAEARRAAFTGFQVDGGMMAAAGDQARFLHCLPAHRGEEVAAEVIDGPTSLVWEQAANRMHSARALLAELVEGHDQ